MNTLSSQKRFASQEQVKEVISWLDKKAGETLLLKGLFSSSKAYVIASVATKGIHIVLLNNREDALYCSTDLYSLIGRETVFFFPSSMSYTSKGKKEDPSHQVQRTAAIGALKTYSKGGYKYDNLIIVAYPHSVSELIITSEKLESNILTISEGDTLSHEFIKEVLFAYSFERVDFVTEPGQFALRGGIIDMFSYSEERPYRIDFFGDNVESINVFDIDTQRSVERRNSIDIYPNIHNLKGEVELEDIFSYAGESATLWISDKPYFEEQIVLIENHSTEDERILTTVSFDKIVESRRRILFAPEADRQRKSLQEEQISFHTTPQPSFNKNFELLAKDIAQKREEGFEVSILSENPNQIERLKSIFSSYETTGDLSFEGEISSIHEGFTDHNAKVCIYTDHQIFDRYHRVKAYRSVEKSERLTINELNSYQIGDYIVHIDHGVGQFGGLVKTEANGKQQEAVKLIYRDGDVIFVSIHGLHRISRYKSKESDPPKIYKLGTGAWQKLKNQTKSKVKDIAKDLVALYSKRLESRGFAFSADSYMQAELEASFIYEDTPDQIKATVAVKEDMESTSPMDRLVCGDVGFGKTEVAIRAAFKAVADSKQVAVLVPTTILALQHYRTFSSRLKEFPCNISYMSRLKSGKEIKEVSEGLKSGRVDIVIGTHRLLNKEIEFKDLGLLIIDEEQKFGVAAKERLKQLKLNVDTLTLSATPIPRTLQFSLLGARDLSIINTPPPNRYPIQTEIITFDEDIIRDAINFEIERGGQVFFVHNRIEDIRAVEDIIKRLCPGIKSCVGHGQMEPAQLEKTLLDFMVGDYDIMIATTIIENGIDIPNANTIIINQAQNFGLSDLHQLRGRVGRSNVKALCLLIVPSMISLTDDARRRVRAIETFSDLGSGFNIAMQDLDIRGAGNLLGAEQSGFIADMGFETYQRILGEAFAEIREEYGIDIRREPEGKIGKEYITDCSIDTDLEILIPDSYVNITAEKIRLYKELDAINEERELIRFIEEIKDRFGPLPEEVEQLSYIVRLRWLAIELGFEKIILKNGMMIAYFVTNQMSGYYKSERFAAILGFLQNQGKGRFKVKEQNDKLYVTIQNIKSVKEAYDILSAVITHASSHIPLRIGVDIK